MRLYTFSFTCLELVFDEAIYHRRDLRDAASSGKQHRGVGALSVHGMCAAQDTPYRACQRAAQPTSASSPSDIRRERGLVSWTDLGTQRPHETDRKEQRKPWDLGANHGQLG